MPGAGDECRSGIRRLLRRKYSLQGHRYTLGAEGDIDEMRLKGGRLSNLPTTACRGTKDFALDERSQGMLGDPLERHVKTAWRRAGLMSGRCHTRSNAADFCSTASR